MTTAKMDEARYEAMLKALTPTELIVEYTRACHEPPPPAATVSEMIRRLVELRPDGPATLNHA
jgi:hypothetical protein